MHFLAAPRYFIPLPDLNNLLEIFSLEILISSDTTFHIDKQQQKNHTYIQYHSINKLDTEQVLQAET
jgi:hypothetical protein